MSSFVLLTKDGLPDLTVEVGKKISKDPVLLSGLFKAIFTFSNEVAESPLQLIQIKGFTIKFLSFNEDFILIVGTDKNISNLNVLMDRVYDIVFDAFKKNKDLRNLEEQTEKLLKESLEEEYDLFHRDEVEIIEDIFEDLNPEIIKVVFWGLLTGKHFRSPRTRSLDFNIYIEKFLEFFGYKTCSKVEICPVIIDFTSKKGDYLVDNKQYSIKKKGFSGTKILKKLNKLGQKKKYKELLIYYQSLISTIAGVVEMSNKNSLTASELKNISLTRHMIGMELEYYSLEQLKLINTTAYELLRNSTDELEWITSWEI